MKVLIVEDDAALAAALVQALGQAGMLVTLCADGNDAALRGHDEMFDAAVLDLGLPGRDGMSVLLGWREQGCDFPVLVLTARGRWSDKLAAFQAGADDYLTKPFLIDEVILRLRVLWRRRLAPAARPAEVGPLRYDPLGDRFTLTACPLALTAQEHRILASLMHRAGQVVSRADLTESVYADDVAPDSNALDVLIARIRRKLQPHSLLHTVRGRGFCLSPAAEQVS